MCTLVGRLVIGRLGTRLVAKLVSWLVNHSLGLLVGGLVGERFSCRVSQLVSGVIMIGRWCVKSMFVEFLSLCE